MRRVIFCACLVASAVLLHDVANAQQDSQYITIAGAVASKLDGAVRTMNATIQVALATRTPPDITHGNHLTWKHGSTKIVLQTTWAGVDGTPWRTSTLRVSTKGCDKVDVASTSSAYGSTGRSLEWLLNDNGTNVSRSNGVTTVTHELEPQRLVMDINHAPCVVLADSQSQAQLSAKPLPTTPAFPESFHTGIEASITEKGYTFHLYESYSASCNSVMFSFYSQIAGYMRILTDYNNNKMIRMHPPNSTHPMGSCASVPLDPKSSMVAFEGGRLASSARFLGFLNQGGEPAVYQPPESGARDLVRGVPVDEWMYREATRDSADRANITGRYTVHLYFSAPEWHFGASNGFRTLQRIELKGRKNAVNGTNPVTHSYDFVDFHPFIPPYITFEPCEMLPGGDGCDCLELGCTSASADDVSFFTNPNGGVTAQDASSVSATAAVSQACETPDGHHSDTEHDRELLGVWFFGVGIGIALALLGMFIAHRVRKKRMSRELEQEMSQQQAASAAPETYAGFAGPSGIDVQPTEQ
eukprot:jgi/Ulvmu1/9908/UM057_0065.1